jgi:DNA-binding transcriptional LysR family regulator
MNWDNLRTFLAIVRAGRVSGAARRLGVEHTTIGRRLAGLEADLGVPLFYRTATTI